MHYVAFFRDFAYISRHQPVQKHLKITQRRNYHA